MQKWEISKCQSLADTTIKQESVGVWKGLRGRWWRRGVTFPLHRHTLNINSSYYVHPPHCAEFLPTVLHSKSSPPLSPCLLTMTATGNHVGVEIRWHHCTTISSTLYCKTSNKSPLPVFYYVDNVVRRQEKGSELTLDLLRWVLPVLCGKLKWSRFCIEPVATSAV